MAIFTDWKPIPDMDMTWIDSNGNEHFTWPWSQHNDDEWAGDIGDYLAEGETITDLETHLVRLKSTTEADDTDADDQLVGPPTTDGTVVKQRISGLEYQRVYRLGITFGPAGNRRTATAVIDVVW